MKDERKPQISAADFERLYRERMAELGSKGGKKAKWSAEKRSEAMRKLAKKRWKTKKQRKSAKPKAERQTRKH